MKIACLVFGVAMLTVPFRVTLASDSSGADQRQALNRKADLYDMEAKQYRAAGKPATELLARRYQEISATYRSMADANR